MAITFKNVRLSFPRVIQPEINKSFPDSPAKYSTNIILPKDCPEFAEFMAEVNKLAIERWKDHAPVILKMAHENKKLRCFGKGEEIINTKTYTVHEGYADHFYLSPSSDKDHPPIIVKRDANNVAKATEGIERQDFARKLYGGCYVNVAVSPWLQDNAGGRAIRANLLAIEFVRDGEPLGESTAVDVGSLFAGAPTPVAAPAGAPTPAGMPFPSFLL